MSERDYGIAHKITRGVLTIELYDITTPGAEKCISETDIPIRDLLLTPPVHTDVAAEGCPSCKARRAREARKMAAYRAKKKAVT